MKAIVIGAGFAGLAAAEELTRGGVEAHVFEARDRVGGRVWSVPFAGAVVERGGEFVLPGYTEMTCAVARAGLRLVRKGTLYGYREPRGGEPVSPAQLADAVQRIRLSPPSGAGTVIDALGQLELDRGVGEALRARLEISCGHPADDLDASALTDGAGSFGEFDTHSVLGGNGRLADALAAALEGTVALRSPVQRVSWAGPQVRVRAAGQETTADSIVIAVPASVIDRIEFDPPLPAAKSAALRAVRFGQVAKLFVATRTPAAPSATMSVPDRYWCYTQLGHDGAPLPFVAAFAGSARALESLGVADGPERWLAALQRLRPELELDPESAFVSRWDDDQWVRGGYSARSVAAPLDTAELGRRVGPIVFAGEHTAGDWHGLMEGALRSGVRAARELLSSAVVSDE